MKIAAKSLASSLVGLITKKWVLGRRPASSQHLQGTNPPERGPRGSALGWLGQVPVAADQHLLSERMREWMSESGLLEELVQWNLKSQLIIEKSKSRVNLPLPGTPHQGSWYSLLFSQFVSWELFVLRVTSVYAGSKTNKRTQTPARPPDEAPVRIHTQSRGARPPPPRQKRTLVPKHFFFLRSFVWPL